MEAQFKISGLKELNRELKALPKDFRDKALNGATGAAARVIRDEAKDNVDAKSTDSGRLRESIFAGIAPKKERFSQWVSQYRVDVRRRGKKAAIYAHMVEFGAVTHKTAKPFMRPAFDNKRMAAVMEFKKILDHKVRFYQRKLDRMRAK